MATVFYRNNAAESIVAVWKIVESEEELMKMLPVNDKIISKVKNFKSQSRKLEYLASRVLLYNYTGFVPDVEYNENGQPYISELNKNISISHTAGYAAISISGISQTGIDIERPQERIIRIAERFIHSDEFSFIPDKEQINYYTLIWCAKETLYKILNKPEIIFNKELIIMPFKIENEGIIKAKNEEVVHEFSQINTKKYILSYIISPNYILVWHY